MFSPLFVWFLFAINLATLYLHSPSLSHPISSTPLLGDLWHKHVTKTQYNHFTDNYHTNVCNTKPPKPCRVLVVWCTYIYIHCDLQINCVCHLMPHVVVVDVVVVVVYIGGSSALVALAPLMNRHWVGISVPAYRCIVSCKCVCGFDI